MADREPPTALTDLRPILGPRADALEVAWLTGSAEERAELEIAAALLRRRIARPGVPLLSPPPAPRGPVLPIRRAPLPGTPWTLPGVPGAGVDGTVRLGRVLHGRAELGWLGVEPHELCSHLCVIGRTGVGKSTLAVRMLVRLLELGIPWIAFDTKRALRQLLALESKAPIHAVTLGRDVGATLRWNPLALPIGIPMDTHRRQVVELLCRSWGAGDAVMALLDRTIASLWKDPAHPPTFGEVRKAMVEEPLKSREATWRQTAVRVLDQVVTGPLGRAFNTRRDAVAVAVLQDHHTLIELDGLTADDMAFAISSLLQHLTARLHAQDQAAGGLRLGMFVDEAHRLLARHDGGRETPVELLLREGRSLGLGLILATQTFGGISPVALANCGTWVAMGCRFRSDVQTAAQGLMLRDDQRDLLTTLPVGEAVVRLGSRWPHPVHVRLPPFDLPVTPVTDMDLARAFLAGPYRTDALAIRSAIEQAWAPCARGVKTTRSHGVKAEGSGEPEGTGGTGGSRGMDAMAPAGARGTPAGARRVEGTVEAGEGAGSGGAGGSGDSGDSGGSTAGWPRTADSAPLEAVPRSDNSGAGDHHPSGTRVMPTSLDTSREQGEETSDVRRRDGSTLRALPDVHADAAALLKSVAAQPLLGVTGHYAAAGLPRRRGDAAKRALVQEGYLTAVDVPVPEGRVVLLAVTELSRSWLIRHKIEPRNLGASPLHAYWQQRLARELRAQGWVVELEHRRDGHAFDVFASKDGATLLCEVETGKSNVPGNLAALAAATAHHKAVLWLDPHTIDRARKMTPRGIRVMNPREAAGWMDTVGSRAE